ncbi:MAG TPA: hypothetical protein VHF46_05520 [Rubrobacteraceae bacterium]|nr:hypothetical protein [Rubrobacteraceae bacterium]
MTRTSELLAGFMSERDLTVEELAYSLEDERYRITFEFAEAVILGVAAPEAMRFIRALDQTHGLAEEERNLLLIALVDDCYPF